MNHHIHPIVRARMAEFLGIESPASTGCSLVAMIRDARQADYRNVSRLKELPPYLEADCEIFRSLWDSVSLLVDAGLICFGARSGKQQTFALVDEWVPTARRLERDEALARLAAPVIH